MYEKYIDIYLSTLYYIYMCVLITHVKIVNVPRNILTYIHRRYIPRLLF
jgi:hypothetical protein